MNNITSLPSDAGLTVLPTAALVAVAVLFGSMLFVGVFVIVVVANRAEPDPSGRRPTAVFEFAVSFLAVFGALFSSFGVVSGLVQLIGSHPGVSDGSQHPVGDAVARVVVLTGLVLLVSTGLLRVYLGRALGLQDWQNGGPGPITRVAHSYAAAVSFLAVLIGSTSLVLFVYQAFRILGPGVFELSGSKVAAVRLLLDALYLTLASIAVLAWHVRLLPGAPQFRVAMPASPGGGSTAGPGDGGPLGPGGATGAGAPSGLAAPGQPEVPVPPPQATPTAPTAPMPAGSKAGSAAGSASAPLEPPAPAPFRPPLRPRVPAGVTLVGAPRPVALLGAPPPPAPVVSPDPPPPPMPSPAAWSSMTTHRDRD